MSVVTWHTQGLEASSLSKIGGLGYLNPRDRFKSLSRKKEHRTRPAQRVAPLYSFPYCNVDGFQTAIEIHAASYRLQCSVIIASLYGSRYPSQKMLHCSAEQKLNANIRKAKLEVVLLFTSPLLIFIFRRVNLC
jgi:hypothetical protein